MKFINSHKNVSLILEDSLLKKLTTIALKNYPNECGGFLMGYYSEDFMTAYITDFILPKQQKSSSFLFERSIMGVQEIFQKFFSEKKHFYLGEWHTHPNGSSIYSYTDLKAMIEIADCKSVNITNPILLILGVDTNNISSLSFYLYNNKGLYKYE
jgi:[CysO sulfur-carrier protein]-S-L-cysteine hydrolase